MTPQQQKDRLELLRSIANEVQEELLQAHRAAGGDPLEIVLRDERIVAVVDDYAARLDEFRLAYYGSEELVEGDAIAVLTGVLIMRHWVFESQTHMVNTPF